MEAVKQGWANLVLRPGASNTNPLPFLGDNNGVALGMLMLLTIFVALVQTSKWHLEKRFLQWAAIGVAYRAIVTYSRGAFLSMGALMFFYLMYSHRRLRSGIGIVVLALIVVPVLPQQFWDRMQTIDANAEQRDESANGRLHFWEVAREMVDDHPVLGIGFSSYKFAYDSYDTSGGAYGRGMAPHSSWFGVLAEVGWTGLTLYILMLLQTIYLAQRTVSMTRQLSEASEYAAFARSLQGCMVVVIVGGTFLHLQYSEMMWHVFGMAIALNIAAQKHVAQVTQPVPTVSFTPRMTIPVRTPAPVAINPSFRRS
jgi:probable O-glycosylation ligase (exosortase A-associated)